MIFLLYARTYIQFPLIGKAVFDFDSYWIYSFYIQQKNNLRLERCSLLTEVVYVYLQNPDTRQCVTFFGRSNLLGTYKTIQPTKFY